MSGVYNEPIKFEDLGKILKHLRGIKTLRDRGYSPVLLHPLVAKDLMNSFKKRSRVAFILRRYNGLYYVKFFKRGK